MNWYYLSFILLVSSFSPATNCLPLEFSQETPNAMLYRPFLFEFTLYPKNETDCPPQKYYHVLVALPKALEYRGDLQAEQWKDFPHTNVSTELFIQSQSRSFHYIGDCLEKECHGGVWYSLIVPPEGVALGLWLEGTEAGYFTINFQIIGYDEGNWEYTFYFDMQSKYLTPPSPKVLAFTIREFLIYCFFAFGVGIILGLFLGRRRKKTEYHSYRGEQL